MYPNELYVISIHLGTKTRIFDDLLTIFRAQVNESVARLLETETFKKEFDSILIVSDEYLYGYDHHYSDHLSKGQDVYHAMTTEQIKIFESSLQTLTAETAKRYGLDLAIAPGTVVYEEPDEKGLGAVENRAYFFLPDTPPTFIDKHKTAYDIFDWNGKKVLISICFRWAQFKYQRLPSADIYFVPSSGLHPLGFGCEGKEPHRCDSPTIDGRSGVVLISADEYLGMNVYQIKENTPESFHLCKCKNCFSFLYKKSQEVEESERATIIRTMPSVKEALIYSPTIELPTEQLSTERPIEQLPIEQLPTEQLPIEQLPTEQLPTEQLPTEQLPTEQLPTEQLSTGLPTERPSSSANLLSVNQDRLKFSITIGSCNLILDSSGNPPALNAMQNEKQLGMFLSKNTAEEFKEYIKENNLDLLISSLKAKGTTAAEIATVLEENYKKELAKKMNPNGFFSDTKSPSLGVMLESGVWKNKLGGVFDWFCGKKT